MGPRNGVPATRASRGAPRGDDWHTCRVFVAQRSSQTPHANRLLVAADRYISERDRIDILADRLLDRVGYQQLRGEFLVEALNSGGQIHRVADHGVFLAPRRADVAC